MIALVLSTVGCRWWLLYRVGGSRLLVGDGSRRYWFSLFISGGSRVFVSRLGVVSSLLSSLLVSISSKCIFTIYQANVYY